jgi:hypothetical protein
MTHPLLRRADVERHWPRVPLSAPVLSDPRGTAGNNRGGSQGAVCDGIARHHDWNVGFTTGRLLLIRVRPRGTPTLSARRQQRV